MDPKLVDALFLAGQFLPDGLKLRLIGIIPGIENYVKSFNTSTRMDEVGMSVGALVKRLPNLRKVVTTSQTGTEGYKYDRKVLKYLSWYNPRIAEFEGFCDQAILDYIERVKKLDPNYDAGDVAKVFEYRFNNHVIARFLQKHTDLKLKLTIAIWYYWEEDGFVQDGRAHLIHDLHLHDGYALRSQLQSVRKLTVSSTCSLGSTLALLPNLEDVTITAIDETVDPDTIQSLLGIKNLRRFNFCSFNEWTDANLRTFQLILMQPSLKQLEFEEKSNSVMKLVNTFLDCDRNDFESLSIGIHVKVEDKIMTINNPINSSLVKLLRKFKRIKEIIVKVKNKKFVEQIQEEINLIIDTLPRNRSLRVQIGGEVDRY